MFSAFTDAPDGRYHLDPFSGAVVDPDIWGTAVESGDTLVLPLAAAGKLVIRNLGAGTEGISYIPTVLKLGKHNRVSVDIELSIGSDPGDGGHAEAAFELWADVNNWIRAGPYRDTGTAVNDRLVVQGKSGGVAFGPTALMSLACDAARHSITFGVVDGRILVFYDGLKVYGVKMPWLFDYECRLNAGTAAAADKITAWYYDFEVVNQFDSLPLTLGANIQTAINYAAITNTRLTAARAAYLDLISDYLPRAPASSSVSINDAVAHAIEFTTAAFGSLFDLSMALDISGARLDYCRLDDGGAFTNQDEVAKGLSSGDVLIVPLAGATADDAIYFGLSGNSHRLDVQMLGGVYNTDNHFHWEYWNGGAWAALTVTDGTIASVEAFGQSGSVTWTEDLGSTAVNGVTAYWVRARVVTAGVSVPIGSHMQFSPHDNVDFDSLAYFGRYLRVEVYRKVNGTYPKAPSDIWEYQQCNVSKIIEIALHCYSDTKIVLTSEVTPTASITIPYTYTTTRVKT